MKMAGAGALAFVLFVFAAPAEAQWDSPVMGFSFDQAARQLRPILGIAGSALAAQGLLMPEGTDAVAVAGRRAFAAANGRLWMFTASSAGAHPDAHLLDGAMPSERIFANRLASAVLLVSRSGQRVQFLSVAPGLEPVVEGSAQIHGELLTALVSDQHRCAILSLRDASGGFLERHCFGANGYARRLTASVSAALESLAWPRDERQLFAADRQSIHRLANPETGGPLETFAPVSEQPAAVLAMLGNRLLAASGRHLALLPVSPHGPPAATAELPEPVTTITAYGDAVLIHTAGRAAYLASAADGLRLGEIPVQGD